MIQIDDERAAFICGEVDGHAQHREVRRIIVARARLQADDAGLLGGVVRHVQRRTVETKIGLAAGEEKPSLRVVDFISQHARGVAGGVEDLAKLRGRARNVQRIVHDLRVSKHLRMD